MQTVYLNGEFLPMQEAKISPMDRGFLFGDGIYEVIPSYAGRFVGFDLHMQRMADGLGALNIESGKSADDWQRIGQALLTQNSGDNLGLYIHVSRGTDTKRHHAYPDAIPATLFAFTFDIPPQPVADKARAKVFKVVTSEDQRWRRCHIKSTSLLGNVMHFQQSAAAGMDETILYNELQEITEASACNVFVVKNGRIKTPPLDNQLLPGVTRMMVLDILRDNSDYSIEEARIHLSELRDADEVWLTSSSKEIAPVVEIDGASVGTATAGDIWQHAQKLFSQFKYDY